MLDISNKIIFDDKLFIAGIAVGIFADAVKLIANYTMYQLGLTKVVFWQIVATRFLEQEHLNQPVALLIGAVADITVSSVLGVIFLGFIYYFGKKFLYLKGIAYGLLVWVSLFGTLLGQSVQSKLPQEPSGILVTIIAHLLFGLGMSFFSTVLLKHYVLKKRF